VTAARTLRISRQLHGCAGLPPAAWFGRFLDVEVLSMPHVTLYALDEDLAGRERGVRTRRHRDRWPGILEFSRRARPAMAMRCENVRLE
jgi:hypothetical protein